MPAPALTVQTVVPDMVLVVLTTNVLVTIDLMAILLGLSMIVLLDLALRVMLGLLLLLLPTKLTQVWNVPTREFAIERLVNAHALITTKVWLVREPSVLRIALEEDFASLKLFSLIRVVGLILLRGMLINMLVAYVIWGSVVQIVLYKNVLLGMMSFLVMAIIKGEIALAEESAIIMKDFASASLDTMVPDVNSKLSLVKLLGNLKVLL